MRSFLEEVVADIRETKVPIDSLVLVVPSKRAGLFLLQHLAKTSTIASFAPQIYTIEEFVEERSGIRFASRTELLFELYTVYSETLVDKAENFYTFSKWANTLLQDFNEIDRYLVPPKKIFSYLSAIQETNHWYLQPEKTPLIENYIHFWNSLEPLYEGFKAHLIARGCGYQGLAYRQASERIAEYASNAAVGMHYFIGFNALNEAESHIIQTLLEQNKATLYWDIDSRILEDPIHDAGYFMRSYLKTWPYFQTNRPKGLNRSPAARQNIKIIGIPKNVSQAKYVGKLLQDLHISGNASLKHTAVVLGNEALLNPILNAIPTGVSKINITMGFPLDKTPVASLINEFIFLYLHKESKGWFYKDVLSFIANPFIQSLFDPRYDVQATLTAAIRSKNWVHISTPQLLQTVKQEHAILKILFAEHYTTPKDLLVACQQLIKALQLAYKEKEDSMALEYLVRINEVFNQIAEALGRYPFIKDLKSFHSLYNELITSETLDFYGEPLEGVQIMGMLESRNLDFETVILTSVNEGILPSGKTTNSFIPFDLKNEFNLPTYKEKDAVYTYHFYRLLQRAKHVFILYNTHPDVLEGGEKSRFISQLLTSGAENQDIRHMVAAPKIKVAASELQKVEKDALILDALKERAHSGFSPTSLSNYIRNPIDFYKRVVLGIKDVEEVEETIAANTFGNIIHGSMEAMYAPFIGSQLSPEKLKGLLPMIPAIVKEQFAHHYPNVSLTGGKNLIAYHVIQRYLENFIRAEINETSKSSITIIGLEEPLKITLEVPGIPFPITLKGTLDRIDRKDGEVRILDYKTGNAKATQLSIVDWEELILDPEKGKAFQLLCYALMYQEKHGETSFMAAVIPFRNLNLGTLPFTIKENKGRSAKEQIIGRETVENFKEQLYIVLREICSVEAPFIAKEA